MMYGLNLSIESKISMPVSKNIIIPPGINPNRKVRPICNKQHEQETLHQIRNQYNTWLLRSS